MQTPGVSHMCAQRQPFNRILCLGLMFMAIANLAKFLLERHTSMAEGPRDGLAGLLFGIALGCVMFGLWRQRPQLR